MAGQLQQLHKTGQQIEEAVGDLIHDNHRIAAQGSISLQGLDQLVQSLEGLGQFVDALANDIGPDLTVDTIRATRNIGLRELALGLQGEAIEAGCDHEERGVALFF